MNFTHSIKIAPSILSADYASLRDEAERVRLAGADLLHVDVMDGHFVPNITLGAPVVKCLRGRVSLPFDVHLMISDPLKYIPDFVNAGADIITVHVESGSTAECIALMKELGVTPAVALKPATPAEAVFPYLNELGMVLVMTVEPGFGGQSFMHDQLEKIRLIRRRMDEVKPAFDLEVDGGITAETAPLALAAGANVLVAGSAVFGKPDRKTAIAALRGEI